MLYCLFGLSDWELCPRDVAWKQNFVFFISVVQPSPPSSSGLLKLMIFDVAGIQR